MTSERATQFASKSPEGWDDHVEAMRATRMFLLQTMGPTRFVVRGEESDRKHTVLVGSRQRCSCGVSLCSHHLFVMLKVLKVPQTNPLAWQTSLIDSEVDCILSGLGTSSGSGGIPTRKAAPMKREFLRRGSGRTSAGGGTTRERDGSAGAIGVGEADRGQEGETRRLDFVPGEVCPVCQEEMGELEGEEAAAGGGMGNLTFCRDGCGNNMHTRCMLMYAEHRRSSGDKPCCPLCRTDWGIASIQALKEDHRKGSKKGEPGQPNHGLSGGSGGGEKKRVVSITCRSCRVKVQAMFFRCLVCTPAGSWDLCRRCYGGVGPSGSQSPCSPSGRRRHSFVQGEGASDPHAWKAAEPPEKRRLGRIRDESACGTAAAAGLLSLQGRDITTADFELLLTLDASETLPLHEHLLRALPLHQPIDQRHRRRTPTANSTSISPLHVPIPLPHPPTITVFEQPNDHQATPSPSCFTPSSYPSPITPPTDTLEVQPLITAPVSGSTITPARPRCCCCSAGDGDDSDVDKSGGDGLRNGVGRVGNPTRQTSGQGNVTGARAPLRRLPCGHHAHDSCLIPILLEGVGRGHPASCSCPLDSSPLFPSLERRAIRGNGGNKRRRWSGPEGGVRGTDGVGATTEQRRQSGLIVEGARATPVNDATSVQHARTAAGRGEMLRNGGNGDKSGSRNGTNGADVLGIMLVGSGLNMAHASPHPEAAPEHAEAVAGETAPVTANAAPEPRSHMQTSPVQQNGTRTLSAPETRSVRRLGIFRGGENEDNRRGESATSGDTGDISRTSSAAKDNSRSRNLWQSGSLRGKRVLGRRPVPACTVTSLLGRGDNNGTGEISSAGGDLDTAVFSDGGNRPSTLERVLGSAVESSLGLSLQSVRLTATVGGKTRRGRMASHENRTAAGAVAKAHNLVLAASSGSGNTAGPTAAVGDVGAGIRTDPRAGDGGRDSREMRPRPFGLANFRDRRPIFVPTGVPPRFRPSEERDEARGDVGRLEVRMRSLDLD